jgi:serine/threonine protein kinase
MCIDTSVRSPEAPHEADNRLADRSGDLAGYRTGYAYQLIEPIGGGGTGTVWRARSLDDEHVAVKLLRDDLMAEPKAVTRFVQERSILLMLCHPHIVRVRDLVSVGTSLGLVMDLVEGGTLRNHLQEHGTLPPGEAATLLAQVAEALAEAHRHGIVHRDLKPDNILLDHVNGRPHCRLTDFGIARILDTPSMTTSGMLLGTANYVAPEVVYGDQPTPAADIYALGVVLFELVTGRPTHGGGPAWAILRRHVDEAPRPVEGMPEAVWQVVQECMDKRPGRRPSATKLAATLRALAQSLRDIPAMPPQPISDRLITPDPPAPKPPSSPSLSRAKVPAVAALVLAALATLAWRFVIHEPSADMESPGTHSTAAPATQGSVLPSTGSPRVSSVGASPTALSTPILGGAPLGNGTLQPSERGLAPATSVWGPWQCGDKLIVDLAHGVQVQTCHTTSADAVRMIGHMTALPGVQADVTMSVVDADTGEPADGPHPCPGLTFTDLVPDRDCGPFVARLPRGHRYVTVQKWVYTGLALLPGGGEVRGTEFQW